MAGFACTSGDFGHDRKSGTSTTATFANFGSGSAPACLPTSISGNGRSASIRTTPAGRTQPYRPGVGRDIRGREASSRGRKPCSNVQGGPTGQPVGQFGHSTGPQPPTWGAASVGLNRKGRQPLDQRPSPGCAIESIQIALAMPGVSFGHRSEPFALICVMAHLWGRAESL